MCACTKYLKPLIKVGPMPTTMISSKCRRLGLVGLAINCAIMKCLFHLKLHGNVLYKQTSFLFPN